jgi:hypothetical protein
LWRDPGYLSDNAQVIQRYLTLVSFLSLLVACSGKEKLLPGASKLPRRSLIAADQHAPHRVSSNDNRKTSPLSPGHPDHKVIKPKVLTLASWVSPTTPAFQISPASDGWWLTTRSGKPLLKLVPELRVAYAPFEQQPHRKEKTWPQTRVPWTHLQLKRQANEGWALQALGELGAHHYQFSLTHTPGDPRLQLQFEVTYGQDQAVHSEVLSFRTAPLSTASLLDPTYQWVSVHRPHFIGALTPQRARFRDTGAAFDLWGGPGLQGVWLRPQPSGALIVELELDHEANHPFRTFAACVTHPRWRVARHVLSASLQRAGARRALEASWVVGSAAPWLISRFPRGFRAAMVLTDHADQSTGPQLEAFAYGRTGALTRQEVGPANPGFVNRGLAYTKTIFLRQAGTYAAQFENPHYRLLLDRLRQQGVEIGLHSVTGGRDDPAQIEPLLAAFQTTYHGHTWIDHQPTTNCEAITNSGWNPHSPWYLLPLLAQHQLRYLWSAEDVFPDHGSLNLLRPAQPEDRRPVLYPFARLDSGEAQPTLLFASSPLFVDRRTVLRRLAESSLSRLETERGLIIGHVYLDTWRGRGRFKDRSLLVETGPDQFALRPEFDELFGRLSQHQARGDLWVTSLAALIEHLRGALQVQLDYHPLSLVLTSQASYPLRGLTLIVPDPSLRVLINGHDPIGQRLSQSQLEVWLDLLPGESCTVQALDAHGVAVPFLTAARIAYPEQPHE